MLYGTHSGLEHLNAKAPSSDNQTSPSPQSAQCVSPVCQTPQATTTCNDALVVGTAYKAPSYLLKWFDFDPFNNPVKL